jgi:hypothetical protein
MLSEFWHWPAYSRYTRALESEVVRLRAENRALVNSVMSVAGLPPLRLEANIQGATGQMNGNSTYALARGLDEKGIVTGTKVGDQGTPELGVPLVPVRRRSWQQVGRLLERQSRSVNQERALRSSATE